MHYEWSHGGSYSRRHKLASRVKAEGRPCWICKLAIDYSLQGGAAAFNLDELMPRACGGSPLDYANVDATHACCNNWRGTKSVEHVIRVSAWMIKSGWLWSTPEQFVKLAKKAEHNLGLNRPPERLILTSDW